MRFICATILLFGLTARVLFANQTVHIGSKKFTENVILAQIAATAARHAGFRVELKSELGGTQILFNALRQGAIDCYPEYSGTLLREVLARYKLTGMQALRNKLAEMGIVAGPVLGFNNTYAIGVSEELARRLGLTKISQLKSLPDLAFGFTNEFLNRIDGWPGLRDHYQLPQRQVTGLDHDLAYRALSSGEIDLTDLYSTDADIAYYHLRVLEDDRHYFPEYQAMFLYRADLAGRAPQLVQIFDELANSLTDDQMRQLNARAKLNHEPEALIAADFLDQKFGWQAHNVSDNLWRQLGRNTLDHLYLVLISLSLAILLAIPLGILAYRLPKFGNGVLSLVGIIQTIPALALLVFMIPLLGIGGPPAMAALFLYSLLPIVRNTHSGLNGIDPALHDSALALGLSGWWRLTRIEFPLALPSVLSGIKTAAVINVGTATLGALIGAGGYGQPILTGIRLDNTGLILQGAIPAALLAILVQGMFDALEYVLIPKGLHDKSQKP